jgi:hypothetical protein
MLGHLFRPALYHGSSPKSVPRPLCVKTGKTGKNRRIDHAQFQRMLPRYETTRHKKLMRQRAALALPIYRARPRTSLLPYPHTINRELQRPSCPRWSSRFIVFALEFHAQQIGGRTHFLFTARKDVCQGPRITRMKEIGPRPSSIRVIRGSLPFAPPPTSFLAQWAHATPFAEGSSPVGSRHTVRRGFFTGGLTPHRSPGVLHRWAHATPFAGGSPPVGSRHTVRRGFFTGGLTPHRSPGAFHRWAHAAPFAGGFATLGCSIRCS